MLWFLCWILLMHLSSSATSCLVEIPVLLPLLSCLLNSYFGTVLFLFFFTERNGFLVKPLSLLSFFIQRARKGPMGQNTFDELCAGKGVNIALPFLCYISHSWHFCDEKRCNLLHLFILYFYTLWASFLLICPTTKHEWVQELHTYALLVSLLFKSSYF